MKPYELKPDADGKYSAKDVADALQYAMFSEQQLHYWRGHPSTPLLEELHGAWKYKIKEIRDSIPQEKKPIKYIMQPISKGRLNRMLKYFQDKDVHVSFEYNNSLGHHRIRKFDGIYDQFTIDVAEFSYDTIYAFKLMYKKDIVFELDLPGNSQFHGLGKIRYINSGPSCYLELYLA